MSVQIQMDGESCDTMELFPHPPSLSQSYTSTLMLLQGKEGEAEKKGEILLKIQLAQLIYSLSA